MFETAIHTPKGVERKAQKVKNLEQYYQEGVQFVRNTLKSVLPHLQDDHRQIIMILLNER